jgi:hypothetical protein
MREVNYFILPNNKHYYLIISIKLQIVIPNLYNILLHNNKSILHNFVIKQDKLTKILKLNLI